MLSAFMFVGGDGLARTIWLLILCFSLHGCGSDSEDPSSTGQPYSVESERLEVAEEDIEIGTHRQI